MAKADPTQPVVKRRRNCGPKTRTGCQTCKVRRVKCDEAKPSCLRCTSTGRTCDGYSPQSALLHPSLARHDTSDLIFRLPTLFTGTKDEKRSFQYFLTHTGAELNGFYSGSFWEQLLLQASAAEPSLRHAVIAIGSLHEEFSNKRLGYGGQGGVEDGGKGQAFAVGQYSKALGHLRRGLATGNQAPITALMSCILFVCFDSLRGHFDTALVHLQSGLKILRDLRKRSVEDEFVINSHLAPLFTRLSLQAILFIDTRSSEERLALTTELADLAQRCEPMPEAFGTLEQARDHMNHTANDLYRMAYMCDGEKAFWEQPQEAYDLWESYSQGNRKWNVAFERFMRAKSASLSTKELRGAALLKIHHMTSHIMAEQTPLLTDPRPMAEAMNDRKSFLKYADQFRTVVNLCGSLIATEEQDILNGKSAATFSTDLGVVGPLYYACVRCQDFGIRNQAIELLARCPRREGMWDSESGVKMIRQFWEIERKHTSLVNQQNPETEIPLTAVMNLEFENGRWQWNLKDPGEWAPSYESDLAGFGMGSESGVMSSPGDEWGSLLDDESWYGNVSLSPSLMEDMGSLSPMLMEEIGTPRSGGWEIVSSMDGRTCRPGGLGKFES